MQLLRQEGGLDQLAQWTPELAQKFEQMLMEYHNIFSLDKNEIGCTPANYTKIQRFLGAARFFRHFIKNYTLIANPLNDLLEGKAKKWKAQPVDLPLEALEAFNILFGFVLIVTFLFITILGSFKICSFQYCTHLFKLNTD